MADDEPFASGATIRLERSEEGFWDARWSGLHGTGDTRTEALQNLGELMEKAEP